MNVKEPLILGLIGYPIKHSLSPAMHNAAFKKLKLNAVYMLFEKSNAEFPHALKLLRLMDVAGFNVTIPYKEEIIPYLDTIDAQAARIGAVNTVVNKKGKFIGYNTDAPGFIHSLRNDLKFQPKGKNIFIVGAGGAGRAIGFALGKEKAKAITFYDIYSPRAEKLAKAFGCAFPGCSVASVATPARGDLSAISLVVNASNCGMKLDDPLPIDPKLLPKGGVVYDIIYNPSPTKLIKAVKARGILGVNGLGMLLCQGALAFEIWTKRKAPVAAMRKALLKELHGKSD